MGNKLMTHSEAARYLNISIQTLRRLGDGDEIPFYRVGNQRRFDPADIQKYLERNRQKAEREEEQ